MEKETIFTEGFIFKKPKEGAPDFVRGAISVKVDEFTKFLQQHNNNGWVNIDLLLSKKGTLYTKLNTYTKANQANSPTEINGDVPFGAGEKYEDQDNIPF